MKENTSLRLKRIMDDRNLKQVDIVNMCQPYCEKYGVKLTKNYLSQYISGKVEPKQRTLSILGMALNVNEAWLMGFDVPMERKETYNVEEPVQFSVAEESFQYFTTDTKETKIISEFNKLNETGKNEAINRVTELTYIPHYTDSNIIPIKSKKKKYEPTEEDIKSLVARNGRKLTREEAIEFISAMYSDDDDED